MSPHEREDVERELAKLHADIQPRGEPLPSALHRRAEYLAATRREIGRLERLLDDGRPA